MAVSISQYVICWAAPSAPLVVGTTVDISVGGQNFSDVSTFGSSLPGPPGNHYLGISDPATGSQLYCVQRISTTMASSSDYASQHATPNWFSTSMGPNGAGVHNINSVFAGIMYDGNGYMWEDCASCQPRISQPIYGCTDPNAINYDPTATQDDGTCQYEIQCYSCDSGCNPVGQTFSGTTCPGQWSPTPVPCISGCTDPSASNYNPSATCDDGSCGITCYQCDSGCAQIQQSFIGTTVCPSQWSPTPVNCITGCTDPAAANYNPGATCDDGSCNYPFNCTGNEPSFAVSNQVYPTDPTVYNGAITITPTFIWAGFSGTTTLTFTVTGMSGTAGSNNYTNTFTVNVTGNVFLGTTLNNLAEGGYTITVVDSNGCSYASSISLNPINPHPCVLPVTVRPITYGCDSATMSIDIGDTSDVYDVVWSDSTGNGVQVEYALGMQSTTNYYTTYIPGDYTVTVYLQGSCTSHPPFTHTFTGITMPVFSGSISGTDETLSGLNDGTAQINGGVNSNDTYLWSTGETTSSISNLAPGTYTCEVMTFSGGTNFQGAKCPYSFSIVIGVGNIYPDVSELDVCLNLNTGKFEFIDNNDYNTGQGFSPPYNIAITIAHSNGLIVHSGLLTSPDITIDNIFAVSRTYDSTNNLGENLNIDIPTYSPNDYIDDVYTITFEWNFDSTSVTHVSKVVHLNATDLDEFSNINVETQLTYNCNGDMESNDMTNYNVSSIPYTFTRTHELFAPTGSGLPSPVVSTGVDYISHDLYSGSWTNLVQTDIRWEIPSGPSATGMYIAACVKNTFTGSTTENVNCFIDDCIINQFIKNLKNRYDAAVCDRDIININKYKDKFQRANELLVLYNMGDEASCASDFDELWDILEITNLDDITSLSCCGDPSVNSSMVADGSATFQSIDCPNGGGAVLGGDNGGDGGDDGDGDGDGDGDPNPCPCNNSSTTQWSAGAQMAGNYSVGDYVNYTVVLDAGTVDETIVNVCFELYTIPTGGFNNASVANEEPGGDNAAYWNWISCAPADGIIWGCTDPLASNYYAGADLDNGSCQYIINSFGCTDSLAVNYDPAADTDDGSCNYINGCATGIANWYGLNSTTNPPLGGYSPHSGHFHEDSSGNVYISGRRDGHDIGFNQWTGSDWQDVFSVFPTAFTINWWSSAVMDSSNNIYITATEGIIKYTVATTNWALLSDPLYTSGNPAVGFYHPEMLHVDSSDNIYLEIWGGIKKWDGSAWSDILTTTTSIGGQTTGGDVSNYRGMLIDSSDNIYKVVSLSGGVGKRLVKYDGSTWTVLGDDNFKHRLSSQGPSYVLRNSLVKDDATGYIYSTGSHDGTWGISKWDGSSWSDITYNVKGGDSFWPNTTYAAYDSGGRVVLDSAGDVYASYLRSYAGPKGEVVVKKLVGTTWVYLTPNTSAVMSNSITANMFIDSLDNIWVNGVVSAQNSVYVLDSCLPSVPANCTGQTTVNDANFESFLEANGMGNGVTGDNLVDTANICPITHLALNSMGIYDLTGIEDFQSLVLLSAWTNGLTSINLTQNTALVTLSLNNNQLTSIDVTQNTLLFDLYLKANQLTALDVTNNTALYTLYCNNNSITSLDVTNNTALNTLYCQNNQLASLDVTNNTALYRFDCFNNQLTTLDVNNNTALHRLDCAGNQLTTLDVSNSTALTYLHCESNNILSLTLGANIDLTTLTLKAYNNNANLTIRVGTGDVPGTSGGSGSGGLQTRVEYATANFTVGSHISSGTTFII